MKTENTTETPICLALNMSKVLNNQESFDPMNKVGPRVCITTATHPGFIGFMANIQTGIIPLAGRYGGGSEELASERTLLAAERTFSAWIRTGLAALGGGLAVARVLFLNNNAPQMVARVIGGLLVIWGASIFVYALISYHRTCSRLSHEGLSRNSLVVMILMTAMLLIIATLVFWMTLQ